MIFGEFFTLFNSQSTRSKFGILQFLCSKNRISQVKFFMSLAQMIDVNLVKAMWHALSP